MTISHPCTKSDRQIVAYIKSSITKTQPKTFFLDYIEKEGDKRKNNFFMVDFGHVQIKFI